MTKAEVALIDTIIWFALTCTLLWALWGRVIGLMDSILARISRGDELETPWLTLRGAPSELRYGDMIGITSEGVGGVDALSDVEKILSDKKYPKIISEELYLVHQAIVVVPRSIGRHGLYRV
jgi:hypothetical protein